VIPQEFDYDRPGSVAEAVGLLRRHGDGARVLAGGHSLLPMMKLRLAAFDRLVDISGIQTLHGIRDAGSYLALGALTTHRDVAESDLVQAGCQVLGETAAMVGDMQVRNRGTIGGSIAHADPHADLPAVLLALDGSVTCEGPDGTRTIAAGDLFVDYLTTAVSPDELITEVRVPKVRQAAYVKFHRRSQDWAIVGVAAALTRSQARIAVTGVGPTPVRAAAAEAAWNGSNAAEAAERAADGLTPPSDGAASGEYRSHLAKVLTRRALDAAAAR
jgi:carbon-monoxide dehydrogenase medium subunit